MMAKKTFDKLEEGNKNLSGVNSLFKTENRIEKNINQPAHQESLKTYSLSIDKSLFKALELQRVETGISIKQQIVTAIKAFYSI